MNKLFGLLIFSFALSANAFAWDDTGHKISAQIAWRQMTPAAREAAVKMLMNAPENSGILNLLPADSRPLAVRQEQMFYTAAYWADLARDEKFPVRRKEYHHGTWHYTDTFWRTENGQTIFVSELQPDAENAVERLFALEKILRDAEKTGGERAVALAWILHIAGDIHQPLHASARVTSEEKEQKGDQGGNTFLLAPGKNGERPDNLHWFWDSVITRHTPRKIDSGDSNYIPKLAARVMKKYPARQFVNEMKAGKFDEWQKESLDVAITQLYPATLQRNQEPSGEYRKSAVKIAEKRLALAGYRMAELLNRVFGS